MKRTTTKLLVWLLTISMLLSNMPVSLAEENVSGQVEETAVYQAVALSSNGSQELTEDELENYCAIAEAIKNDNTGNDTITYENGNSVTVYSVMEGAPDGNTVLQECTYTSDENTALSIASYSEIKIPGDADAETDATGAVIETEELPIAAESNETPAGDSEVPTEEMNNEASTEAADSEIPTEAANCEIPEEATLFAGSSDEKNADADLPAETTPYETEFKDEYKNVTQTVVTAEHLLSLVQSGDDFAVTFARKLGFGRNASEISGNLQKIVDEYKAEIAKGNTFEEPRFVINGVDIVLNKSVEEVKLVKNEDGTYSASLDGSVTGYRTDILIDAEASVTIVYDEKGKAEIERRVSSGKPTDFVITLDVSGSMRDDGRDTAMFSALKVVLEEILQEKENTVSIVFWASNGQAMQVQVDESGVSQIFSGADGITAEKLFDAPLVGANGNTSSFSLSDATITGIQNLYRTGSGTKPYTGLYEARDLLSQIEASDDRNVGIMLFTDGAVGTALDGERTVLQEKELAEKYGATIVNVSIGDEYDVKKYERYLDPNSPNYIRENDQVLQDHVLYYNIPKLTNQELADRVSEMFEVAFEDITTETKKLQTEAVTDGILAAYGAQLIETIPEKFELVELKGEKVSYEITARDPEGNVAIKFNLDDILSEKDQVISYCVIPTDSDSDIGVTAVSNGTDTVLHAQPVDRIDVPEEYKTVTITVEKNTSETPSRPDFLDNHDHVYDTHVLISRRYTEYDDKYHYVSSEKYQSKCSICGLPLDVINEDIPIEKDTLEEHQIRNGRCIRCGYVGEDAEISAEQKQYYEHLLRDIADGKNSLEDENSFIVRTLKEYYHKCKLNDKEITEVIETLRKAPEKYRYLYLLALFNYDIRANYTKGPHYSWPWHENAIEMTPESAEHFSHTFFHESGHATQLNLYYIIKNGLGSNYVPGIRELEIKIQDALFRDIENRIRTTVKSLYGVKATEADEDAIVRAFINGNKEETGIFGTRLSDISIRGDKRLSDMYKEVRKTIEDSIRPIPYSNASMVSDVYGGVTNNKIDGGPGHPNTYWYTDDGSPNEYQMFESWAEFFSAKIRKDDYNINKNAEYFPESTKLLEDLADELYDYYLDYYTNVFEPYKHNLDGLRTDGPQYKGLQVA